MNEQKRHRNFRKAGDTHMEIISVLALIVSAIKVTFMWLNYRDQKRTLIAISNHARPEELAFFKLQCTLSWLVKIR